MTLLLTFFVILVSLSVFDETSRQRVMESVNKVFSIQDSAFFPFSLKIEDEGANLPPPDLRDDSLVNIRRIMQAGDSREISLSRNNQVIIITIDNALLFPPGQTALTEQGGEALAALAPYLAEARHPLRIAAHGTPGLEGDDIPLAGLAGRIGQSGDLPRALSLERAQTIYEFLARQGVATPVMRMEAYGADRPRFPNYGEGAESNPLNRRMDIIVDRRDRIFAGSDGFRASPREEGRDFRLEFPEPALPGFAAPGSSDAPDAGAGSELVSPFSAGEGQ
jgi:chemotaxis protein MotB